MERPTKNEETGLWEVWSFQFEHDGYPMFEVIEFGCFKKAMDYVKLCNQQDKVKRR